MRTTHYIVQSFHKQGKKLVADPPKKMLGEREAVDGAKRLVDRKAGVVAYAIDYDDAADQTEDPKVLFRTGQLPRELAGEDE